MTRTSVKTLTLAVLACAAAAVWPASAQESVAVGQLNCGIKGGVGFIFGSTKELRCVFRVHPDDPGERYEGAILKFGLDVGVTNNALLTWAVFAPAHYPGPGALAGRYVGVAADASVGVGGGANVLVGGSNNSFSLQPLSVQGQTGLNAVAAIAEVELVPFNEGK